ncbi:YoaK family protein [Marinospirillum perlucidum]|uniref:YoaK family protein n=1 Tax=Marinospirillum perlucidum TaxID=1982602 RepID=UPI001C49AAE4|nr:YoaK family protein [Marinospirillum perlucidum]
MIRKLPRWVEIGGFWLAMIAGSVNAIGVLGFQHQAVSHLTGTSTLASLALVDLAWSELLHLVLILISFVAGAAFSGALINNAVLRLGHRYGVALICEALLLLLAMLALSAGSNSGHYLASAACGLQNAMVSTYSGAVVRTTHVSGLFTDLGSMLGARLRGHPLDRRKLLLFSLLISGFLTGGSLGTLAFIRFGFAALAFSAFAALLLAIIYWIYYLKTRRLPAS